MPQTDTLDKVIGTYFRAVTLQPFVYKNARYEPRPLHILPCLYRGYGCPSQCGACCPRFSLTYLPTEIERAPNVKPRIVSFNGRKVMMVEDDQSDRKTEHHCRHVSPTDGRCGIHGRQPFSCDFEIVRFKEYSDRFEVGTMFFGRGWQMLRIVDNERGAKCTMEPWSENVRADLVRKFTRLHAWTDHFGLRDTHLPALIEHVQRGPTSKAVVLGVR